MLKSSYCYVYRQKCGDRSTYRQTPARSDTNSFLPVNISSSGFDLFVFIPRWLLVDIILKKNRLR